VSFNIHQIDNLDFDDAKVKRHWKIIKDALPEEFALLLLKVNARHLLQRLLFGQHSHYGYYVDVTFTGR